MQLPNKLVYWRALLQQLLRDNLGFVCNEWRVGKISPKGLNFSSYARKALKRLGFESKVSTKQAYYHGDVLFVSCNQIRMCLSRVLRCQQLICLLKNTHFRFHYNSGVSWSIFLLFELVETGMNTLQSSQQNLQITLIVSPHYLP